MSDGPVLKQTVGISFGTVNESRRDSKSDLKTVSNMPDGPILKQTSPDLNFV